MVLDLKKLESPSSKDACAKIGWYWLSGSREEDFLILSMYFRYLVIFSPWKRVGPFIWTNLNPLHPRMLCAKFGWNWPSGSGEEDENVKSFRQCKQRRCRQQRRTTEKFWSEKLTWAFGSGELKRTSQKDVLWPSLSMLFKLNLKQFSTHWNHHFSCGINVHGFHGLPPTKQWIVSMYCNTPVVHKITSQ